MTLLLEPQPIPLMLEGEGTIRISGTRVTLDALVYAFLDGATAEEIAQQYPSLALHDIYSVIGYYLSNRKQIDAYIREREQTAQNVRAENERNFAAEGIRARLLARQGQ